MPSGTKTTRIFTIHIPEERRRLLEALARQRVDMHTLKIEYTYVIFKQVGESVKNTRSVLKIAHSTVTMFLDELRHRFT